jgi:hypothetical protein
MVLIYNRNTYIGGLIKERLIGVVHVSETSASYLKSNIDSLFAKYGLSTTQVRGQGYDGASNMRGLGMNL